MHSSRLLIALLVAATLLVDVAALVAVSAYLSESGFRYRSVPDVFLALPMSQLALLAA